MKFTSLYRISESKFTNISNVGYAPLLSNEVREKAKFFFKKYGDGNKDSKHLNWGNHKNFKDEDFKFLDNYIDTDENGELEFIQSSKSELKKDINKKKFNVGKSAEELFKDNPDENILFHIYPEISNEDWLFVSPLTWEAAVFMDSTSCGLSGACWCIGYKKENKWWKDYTKKGSKFVLAFNKKYTTLENTKIDGVPFPKATDENGYKVKPSSTNKWGIAHVQGNGNEVNGGDPCSYQGLLTKFMIQVDNNKISVWIQPDKEYSFNEVQKNFGVNFGVSESDILNLDFTEFNKYNNPAYIKVNLLKDIGYIINDDLTQVIIPEGVKGISDETFEGCTSIKSIKIPESVNSIGKRAFCDCTSLVSINLPKGISVIEQSLFENCSSLTSVTIPEGVTFIGNYAFNGCSRLTSISIPEGVTEIGDSAFCYSNLTSIDIPDSVIKIQALAFENCRNLRSVKLSRNLRFIGFCVFESCSSLVSLDIPDSVEFFDGSSLNWCNSLKHLSIPDTLDIKDLEVPEGCEIIRRESSKIIAESKIKVFNKIYNRFN